LHTFLNLAIAITVALFLFEALYEFRMVTFLSLGGWSEKIPSRCELPKLRAS
jgi:hypothetical protein